MKRARATGKEVSLSPCAGGETFAAAFSPDGKILAAVCGPAVCCWDAASGEQVRKLNLDRHSMGAVAFSPDSRSLVWVDTYG